MQEAEVLAHNAEVVVRWTWITFGVVAFVLYKIAWKPILAGLDAREKRIRDAIEGADKVSKELAAIDATRQAMLAEVEAKSQQAIAQARAAAIEAATGVERRSAEKVKILYENAERDIEAMKNSALASLKKEQLDLILKVAGKVVALDMNTEKNRVLTDKLLAELN